MLTGDLVRARTKGSHITPTWAQVGRDDLKDAAQDLIATFDLARTEHWRRRDLDDGIATCIGDSRSHKTLRGLSKLLLDKSKFEVVSPIAPAALREQVFQRAREAGPLALDAGPLDRITASQVLQSVADELGVSSEQVSDALYADLKSEQRLVSAPDFTPEGLLQRYKACMELTKSVVEADTQ